MSAFDIAVLGVLAISAAFAFWRGFTTEALSLVSWGGAVALALFVFPWTREWTQSLIKPEWLADFGTLLISFVVIFLILRWLADKLGERVRESRLGPVDRMFGAIFGMIRGLIVISAIYLLFDYFVRPREEPDWIADAKTGAMVKYSAQLMRGLAERGEKSPDIDDLTRRARDMLPSLRERSVQDSAPAKETAYRDEQRQWLDGLLERIESASGKSGSDTSAADKGK